MKNIIKLTNNENSDDIAKDIANIITDTDKLSEVIVSLSTFVSTEDRKWCINRFE